MKYVTVKLTEQQVKYVVNRLVGVVKDLNDFDDSKYEIAFTTRIINKLVKSQD